MVHRRLSFVVGPTPPFEALGVLHGAGQSRGRVSPLVEGRLGRAITQVLNTHEPALQGHERVVRWLIEHGLVAAETRGALWRARLTGRVDLRVMARDFERGSKLRAYTALYAVRALLAMCQGSPLWMCLSLTLGPREVTVSEALKQLEALARAHGFDGFERVPKRFVVAPTREASAEPEAQTKAAPKATPKTTPKATPKDAPRAEAAPAPGVKKPKARAKRPVTGFGGLPDDAEPCPPPPAPGPALSPRGLSFEAEYFLEVAKLTEWPCAPGRLVGARREVIAALHPDRAGEASGRDFHRALKGYEALTAALAALPQTPEKPSVSSKQSAGAVNEWPPPPTTPRPKPRPSQKPKVDSAPLSADAAYFLREAALAWPVELGALRQGWHALAARLRRATPASAAAAAYTQAQRGYESLAARLTL
ncbi:MAG: hypothetical protein JNK72_02815 [Myxococcales bacterium]|nr:hypothetical protein [Myxococcales bacterium]